jgi:hypothetical protein
VNITLVQTKIIKEYDSATKGPVERAETTETVFESHPYELLKSVAARVSKTLNVSGILRNNGAVVPLEGTLGEYHKKIGGGPLSLYVS